MDNFTNMCGETRVIFLQVSYLALVTFARRSLSLRSRHVTMTRPSVLIVADTFDSAPSLFLPLVRFHSLMRS